MTHNMKLSQGTNSQTIHDLSIYIPVVFGYVTEDLIKQRFDSLGIGSVSSVVFVRKQHNKQKRMAFVYFNNWYGKDWAQWLKEHQETNKNGYKLTYDKNRFWALLPNKSKHDASVVKCDSNPAAITLNTRLCRIEQILFPLRGEMSENSEVSRLKAEIMELKDRILALEMKPPVLKRQVADDYTFVENEQKSGINHEEELSSSVDSELDEKKGKEICHIYGEIGQDNLLTSINGDMVSRGDLGDANCLTNAWDKYIKINRNLLFRDYKPSSMTADNIHDLFFVNLYDVLMRSFSMEDDSSNVFSNVLLLQLYNMYCHDKGLENAAIRMLYALKYVNNTEEMDLNMLIKKNNEFVSIKNDIVLIIEGKMANNTQLLDKMSDVTRPSCCSPQLNKTPW